MEGDLGEDTSAARRQAAISNRRSAHPKASVEAIPAIRAFLAGHGLAGARLTPLSGGGNNRVYRVALDGREAVLKQYFQRLENTHDRFASERAIYDFLWPRGGVDAPSRWLGTPTAAAPVEFCAGGANCGSRKSAGPRWTRCWHSCSN